MESWSLRRSEHVGQTDSRGIGQDLMKRILPIKQSPRHKSEICGFYSTLTALQRYGD